MSSEQDDAQAELHDAQAELRDVQVELRDVQAELRDVQVEFLRPDEVAAALKIRSVAYLPLGSIEFHAAHLPIGLDGLTAHGVCTRAAARSGGIVFPALYYGVGGGHTAYPWTIMASSDEPLRALLQQSFARLQDFGVDVAVLFTGHFSDEQLGLIDDIAEQWNSAGQVNDVEQSDAVEPSDTVGHRLRVLALAVNRAGAAVAPDHAGVFESSLLSAMHGDRIRLDRLPPLAEAPADDPGGDVMGDQRHDPSHPLYGIFGPDPRNLDPDIAQPLLEQIVRWTIAEVDQALSQKEVSR